MLIRKQESKKFSISGGTEGFLYPSSPEGDQTIAYVEMNGTYPEKGYSVNDVCTETFFLIEGNLEVEIDGTKSKLKKGDMIMIFPGQKYRTNGCGKILDLITPAWEKNNNKIIKE